MKGYSRMKEDGQSRSVAEIFADMAAIGAFLPGSVRASTDRRRNAKGEVVAYEAQPIFTYRAGNGRHRCKRIPKSSFEVVKALVGNYRRFKALLAELEWAMVEAHLPGSKKNG